jgi:hypothetical protein
MKIKSLVAAAVLGIVSLSSQAASYSFNIDYTGSDIVTGLNGTLWDATFGGGLSNVQLDGSTLGVSTLQTGNLYSFSLGTSDPTHVLTFDASGLFNKQMNFTTITAGGTPISLTPQANVTPVPEPETYAMLLAGLGAIGFMSKRRQRIGQS